MKIPQPLNTIFHDDTGGSAQSTIRYSYVRGMRTACPNSAASFCGKIRAFRERLNNNRPGLKRSNSSPGDIAVQKIYTEYVFLHRDFSFSLSFFFFFCSVYLTKERLIIARQIGTVWQKVRRDGARISRFRGLQEK